MTHILIPRTPSMNLLRPFIECPTSELDQAWAAMVRIAEVQHARAGSQCLQQIEEPAGAAPAAVAPQGVTAWMHPETLEVISDAKKHEMSTQYGTETRRKAEGYSVAMAPVEQSAAAPALEAPGAREVTVERYEIPGGMRSALEDVISYLRSHGRCDLVRLMQELYTAISPWDGGSCSDVPDALVPARPDAEYLLSIARNNRWPMLMRAHIKSAALATAPALEAPAAPVGSARQFIEWMYSQPEDREPTTAEGALLEFEAHLAAAAPQAPAAPADAQAFAEWWDRERGTARNRLPGDDWMDLSNDDREQYEAAFNAGMRAAKAAPAAPAVDAQPLIARNLAEWHEDDGDVAWWAWCGHGWAGEPAWIGRPTDDGWPGYHTHWTAHPAMPPDIAAQAKEGGDQ